MHEPGNQSQFEEAGGVEPAVVLPEEISGGAEVLPHESEAGAPASCHPTPASAAPENLRRWRLARAAQALRAGGMSWRQVAAELGESKSTLQHWLSRLERGLGLDDGRPARSGRRRSLSPLPAERRQRLQALFLQTNRGRDAGSMRAAAALRAAEPETPEDWRESILASQAHSHLPAPVRRILAEIRPAHFAFARGPGMAAGRVLGGNYLVHVADKLERRRVIESDDGTLNFAAWVPWPMGGDPCSDRHGVRLGRWQWLPLIEAGWTHQVVGYALVCRPRGSYRAEDIRAAIHALTTTRGLPDSFRFERGVWESDQIVELLRSIGVELTSAFSANGKAVVEGFFNKAWTYLSTACGQLGRFRGDMEAENRIYQACREGRRDPREVYPSLEDAIRALDGLAAWHNGDTIRSRYGTWVPDERARALDAERPWRQLEPAGSSYLFSPVVRTWTVHRGTVGGRVALSEDLSLPYYFATPDLWRWNGQRVRVWFDPLAEPCVAMLTAADGRRVLGSAPMLEHLPSFTRAARGWMPAQDEPRAEWRRSALAALRREVRVLDNGGRVAARNAVHRDGRGAVVAVSAGGREAVALPGQRHIERQDRRRNGDWPSPATKRSVLPEDWRELADDLPQGRGSQAAGPWRVTMEDLNELSS